MCLALPDPALIRIETEARLAASFAAAPAGEGRAAGRALLGRLAAILRSARERLTSAAGSGTPLREPRETHP